MALAQATRSPGAALVNALPMLRNARDTGEMPAEAADLSSNLHSLLTAAERSQRATAQFRSDAQSQDASESLHDLVERALLDLSEQGLYQGVDRFESFSADLALISADVSIDPAAIGRVVDVLERVASYAFRTSLPDGGSATTLPKGHLSAAQVERAGIDTPLALSPDLRTHLRTCDRCSTRVAEYHDAAAITPFESYPTDAS
jgi:hypothetical protein